MKYSRGRIIALTVLSVAMALALFCAGLVIDWRNFTSRAVNTDTYVTDPDYIPTFDDLYQRIPFDEADTGTVTLGQETKLTLLEERYNRGILTEFLNADTKRSYTELQKKRSDGYPSPVFTSAEMRSIATGVGRSIDIPVVMLDPYNHDDIVLFELTNLTNIPTNLSITRDGVSLDQEGAIVSVDANLPADQVYAGIPEHSLVARNVKIENNDVVLYVSFNPNSRVSDGYEVRIKDSDSNYLYNFNSLTHQLENVETIANGTTQLYNENGILLYRVVRDGAEVKIYDAKNVSLETAQTLLGTAVYNEYENQMTNYQIGAVAYNGNALRGMFQEQGFYQISFKQKVATGNGVFADLNIVFEFMIVNKIYYQNFPRFDTKNRVQGNAEIYNYSYESEYPVVSYSADYFDVQIQTNQTYQQNDPSNSERALKFFNIGEYKMISALQCYNPYLAGHQQEYKNRGVDHGFVKLKRFESYQSVLNVLGFQAYYGGQHTNQAYNGPLPFFSSDYNKTSSDISALVRASNMTVNEVGFNIDNMRVSDALNYSNQLANYLTTQNVKPVRTNFPPVKIVGNVAYATGAGMNGESAVVLSSVAFKPAYGINNSSDWESSTLEVGALFEEAGQYLVTVYFKVNNKVTQQVFFFEIINSAKITFDVTDAYGNVKTYYAGELELNRNLNVMGNKVSLNYEGSSTLGKFEVPPSLSLSYAPFGDYTFNDVNVSAGDYGAFSFNLNRGQYRLTVKYGAHSKSNSIFNIIVDDTSATGIKANTTASALRGLPDNVAVVGAGDVNLTWAQKASGIEFTNVLYEFYEMKLENNGVDPNFDRNYFNLYNSADLRKLVNLYSAYQFSTVASKPNNGYVPVKTATGWTIDETFTQAGLHLFTLVDAVGNETQFMLIIDNSTPTFVQSGEQTEIITNIVNFDEEVGVYVGFGVKKLIPIYLTFENFFDGMTNANVLITDSRQTMGITKWQTSISVGLAKVEYSYAGNAYQAVSSEAMNNGYMILKEENTYYFRVTDLLGNIGEYYIVLTHDNCFGRVYADKKRPTISTENEYKGLGMITDQPGVYTSLVNATGGMSNRPFVSFAFEQKSDREVSCVDKVYLQYYPLTYQTMSSFDPMQPNPNYPFADKQVNNPTVNGKLIFAHQDKYGVIYSYQEIDAGNTVRLALFNANTTTPSGMYILTRTYKSTTSTDQQARDYYFIVDNQKMLYYAEGDNPYQTALKINFANTNNAVKAKTADAKVINDYNHELSSDRIAWVNGFSSKYAWKHEGTVYAFDKDKMNFNFVSDYYMNPAISTYNFNFPSLTPRFSYVSDNQIIQLGEGSGVWSIGDPASANESGFYKLIIADDARNISCMLVNGNIIELKDDENAPTSANYDYLLLNLDTTRGAKAEIQVTDDKVISTARMKYDGESYYCIIDPAQIDQLTFSFTSDPASMFTNIDVQATTASWTANGFAQPVTFAVPTPKDNQYSYHIMQDYLSGKAIEDGYSLHVSLIAEDNATTNYVILFDTSRPTYNLSRVKDGDNLAQILNDADLPSGYVYGLSNSFVFGNEQGTARYLDTETITYREVDYSGEGVLSAVRFPLYTGADGEVQIPFTQLVGLHDNEMKYYVITETDYAGHSINYMIQVQGVNYVNNVSFIGAITEESEEVQIGCEMHVSASSVHQFFLNNNSFRFENGDDYYMVLGSTAYWHIGNDIGNGPKNEANLVSALNNWINVATENGVKCAYTLYDRIGEKETFEFYNIRETAPKIQLDCYQAGIGSNVILTNITNYNTLPKILFDSGLSSLYKMTVQDITTNDVSSEVYFSLHGASIQGFDVTHDLIITVTDPFGRVSMTEYHQQVKSTINFTVHGNTVTQDGVIYAGDERGVEFSYLRTAYNVLIYDAGTGDLLKDLQPFISNDMIYHTFIPKSGATTIEQYRIVATGRASGTILFDQLFIFDTRLPTVDWKNASDQAIEVEGEVFVSDVCFDISNSLVTTTFPVMVSYTRTFNYQVEHVTLKPGTTKYTFKDAGEYQVTLRNSVWAEKTYTFEIAQIDDTLVLVYDDEKEVEASPSDYKFIPDAKKTDECLYIPRYVFTTSSNGKLIDDYKSHGLDIKVGQTNRILAGNAELKTDFYYFDRENNTLVWRLAFLLGENNGVPVYDNPIYFATTGVADGELNNGTAITLSLNGNPNVGGSSNNRFIITPSQTTFHEIKDSFMQAHDDKVDIKLHCDPDILRDENNLPCYMVEGNIIVVDCYYNGTLVKTLHGDGADQVFTVNRYDAGYYEFVVHDLVGNHLYFGNSEDENDVRYRQERYMLMVMTKPMVLINEKQPVNGMIYNDQVELKLVTYGNKFLSKRYAGEIAQDKLYFNKYFCISKMEVTYTGSTGTVTDEIFVNGNQSTFYWSDSGSYRIKVTYRISENVIDDLQAEYQFQIIPAHTIRESFSMSIYPDVQVESVTRDGYQIHDFDDIKVNEYMEFSADNNPGSYVVTLKTFNNILQDYIMHEVKFNIQHKANSASNYFVLSSGSGSATTGAVTLYYNPYWLYHAQGKVTIYLYKNFVEQEKVTVDSSVLNNGNYNPQELFTVSDAGLYSVVVKDADEDPVYMDSWTINKQESPFGYIILAVVLGIVGVAALVFLRLRSKMTTK